MTSTAIDRISRARGVRASLRMTSMITAAAIFTALCNPAAQADIAAHGENDGIEAARYDGYIKTDGPDLDYQMLFTRQKTRIYNNKCYGTVGFDVDVVGARSKAERRETNEMINEIIGGRRILGPNSTSPVVKGSWGEFDLSLLSPPEVFPSSYMCPDWITPASSRRMALRSSDETLDWWKQYETASTAFLIFGTVSGALIAFYVSNPVIALAAAAGANCLAGAMGQMMVGAVAGRPWRERGKRAVAACLSDMKNSAAVNVLVRVLGHMRARPIFAPVAEGIGPWLRDVERAQFVQADPLELMFQTARRHVE